jgi:hypothetical protein
MHNRSLEEHVQHVRCVLNVFLKNRLRVKRSKCEWAQERVEFCGFTISGDGIHTQEHKTAAVRDWPQPQNEKEVRGFLGLTSYNRNFIQHYAHMALPLYEGVQQSRRSRQAGSWQVGSVESLDVSTAGNSSGRMSALERLKR